MGKDEPVFTPSDFIRYIAEARNLPINAVRVPERLLMTYQRSAYEYGRKLIDGRLVDWWIYGERQPFCTGEFSNAEIGLGLFWIGAPAAVMTLEELIACGARTIFEVGTGGGLQDFLEPGSVVVVTEAIRDEGTSRHYLRTKLKVESSARLRDRLTDCLREKEIKHYVGPVWSTDGVYRETRGKFRRFRDRGILAVNMETSAVFALARFRGVEAASAQVISDILTEMGWVQAFEHKLVQENTNTLVKAALTVLSSL